MNKYPLEELIGLLQSAYRRYKGSEWDGRDGYELSFLCNSDEIDLLKFRLELEDSFIDENCDSECWMTFKLIDILCNDIYHIRFDGFSANSGLWEYTGWGIPKLITLYDVSNVAIKSIN